MFLMGRERAAEPSSSSTENIPGQFWVKLWKCKALPRCKELVWRICLGALPVNHSLACRHVEVEVLCPVCLAELESDAHAMLHYGHAQQTWFSSRFGLRTAHYRADELLLFL